MIDEKRRHARQPAQFPLQIVPTGRPAFATQSIDLSVGGMFVANPTSAETMVFGESIEIELNLPRLGPTRLPAVVRWLRSDGFGLQFGLLGALHTHALVALVASLQSE